MCFISVFHNGFQQSISHLPSSFDTGGIFTHRQLELKPGTLLKLIHFDCGYWIVEANGELLRFFRRALMPGLSMNGRSSPSGDACSRDAEGFARLLLCSWSGFESAVMRGYSVSSPKIDVARQQLGENFIGLASSVILKWPVARLKGTPKPMAR
jgi:hypothetical protein